ncbi:MAG: hypothetical protein M3440_07345 [Chloroflexota bacterium]|nr:hypothetical protein [Chloroflexota bacterium]
MSGMTNYLEDAVLNHILRGVAFPTLPASLHFGLLTAAPTDAGGGTEVTGGAYARVAITRATASFAVPADNAGVQQTSNSVVVTFATPTANWGTVTHLGVYDAPTAGNLLYWNILGTSRNILSGDNAPSFAVAALTFSQG